MFTDRTRIPAAVRCAAPTRMNRMPTRNRSARQMPDAAINNEPADAIVPIVEDCVPEDVIDILSRVRGGPDGLTSGSIWLSVDDEPERQFTWNGDEFCLSPNENDAGLDELYNIFRGAATPGDRAIFMGPDRHFTVV